MYFIILLPISGDIMWFYRGTVRHACDAEITLILWWFAALIKDPGTFVQWMFLMTVTFDLKLMGKTDCIMFTNTAFSPREETKRFSELKENTLNIHQPFRFINSVLKKTLLATEVCVNLKRCYIKHNKRCYLWNSNVCFNN